MFKNLKIRNFQSHLNSSLEFPKGVSVLIGSSDQGKSSVFRALRWLLENRPLGGAFRSWFSGSREPVEVELTTAEGDTIIHRRMDEVNSYELNGEKLEAHGAEVPDVIRDSLKLGPYNFSSQFDRYFLLQDSPGEVARRLNSVVKLDEIDEVLRKVNQIIRQADQDVKAGKEVTKELGVKVESFAYLVDVEEVITRLAGRYEKWEEKKAQVDGLGNLLERLFELGDKKEDLDEWLKVEKEYKWMVGLLNELDRAKGRQVVLNDVLEGVREARVRAEGLEAFVGAEGQVCGLRQKLDQLRSLQRKQSELSRLLKSLEDTKELKEKARDRVALITNLYLDIVREQKICPFCLAEVTEEKIEHIREHL